MKTVIIHAGLANKMFEYAFYKGLESKCSEVAIDQETFKPLWSFEDISLDDAFINLSYREDNSKNLAKKFLYRKSLLGKLMRRILCFFPDYKLVRERHYEYDPYISQKLTKNCTIYGLWQTEKYFEHCKDLILNEFTFKPLKGEENIAFGIKVKKQNAVSVHVRKGKDYNHLDKVCTIEYYKKAIQYIKIHVETPVFYVFTDNKEWVKENFYDLDINYSVCDWNPVSGKESFRDMQLMSLCKHHIIANSSFSWWGAYLDRNPQKIVVAPQVWFGNKKGFFMNQSDIIPDSWVRL